MRVLVTGREGQLVRSLVERAQGDPLVTLVAVGRPELDLEEPATVLPALHAHRPDVVINAAAYTAVDQAEDEPERAFRVNGAGAGALAAAAAAVGAPIIQMSTDYVFDGRQQGAYREGAQTSPLGVYGRSKLDGEVAVRTANPKHMIVRTAWVYSPFGRNFVRTMVALASTRHELTVVADQRGSPSSALDLADGLLAVLRAWAAGENTGQGETYHLAGTGTATWFEFARAIFECSARRGLPTAMVSPISTTDWPTKAPRPANSVLDTTRFTRDFGFSMPPWTESLAEVIDRLAGEAESAGKA